MSYVCLWSPSWPTGADFPADLVASLLGVAPRVAVGERGLVWGDARGLHGAQLAEQMLRVGERLWIRRRARRRGAHACRRRSRGDAEHDVARRREARAGRVVHRAVSARRTLAARARSRRSQRARHRDVRRASPRSTPKRSRCGSGSMACGSGSRARADDERWLFKIPLRALAERVAGVGGVRAQGSGAVAVRHQLARRHGVHVARRSAASARARWRSSSRSAIARSARTSFVRRGRARSRSAGCGWCVRRWTRSRCPMR